MPKILDFSDVVRQLWNLSVIGKVHWNHLYGFIEYARSGKLDFIYLFCTDNADDHLFVKAADQDLWVRIDSKYFNGRDLRDMVRLGNKKHRYSSVYDEVNVMDAVKIIKMFEVQMKKQGKK